jgi:AraC-like DNA-binding protein
LLYTCPRLTEWNFENLSAPFWRFYYNDCEGAEVSFKGTPVLLQPDQVVFITPGTAFSTKLVKPVRHFFVHFTLDAEWGTPEPGIYSLPANTGLLGELQELFGRIEAQGRNRYLDCRITELLVRSIGNLPDTVWKTIEHSFQHRIPNSELARAASLSTNAFIRLFTEQTGVSPARHSLRLRLDKAAMLLHEGSMSIDQIAQQCGFWDRNYFSKMFHNYFMISPAAYRKQSRRAAGNSTPVE